MAEKQLKTKVALLYKTESEWANQFSTYVPLKGEVCYCLCADGTTKSKIGTGGLAYQDLPFVSADVISLFDATEYGFKQIGKEDQVVAGRALIDDVLDAYRNKRLVEVQLGHHTFNVINIREAIDDTEPVAFSCINVAANLNKEHPVPSTRRVLFIYNPATQNTLLLSDLDSDHVTRAELETKLQALNEVLVEIQGKVNSVIDVVAELISTVEADEKELADLKAATDTYIEIGSLLKQINAKINSSQNDYRICLDENSFVEIPFSGIPALEAELRVYPINVNAFKYKAGNYENYEEEFLSVLPTDLLVDEDNRKYAPIKVEVAEWNYEETKWIPASTFVTDDYYPNYGRLVEWYDVDNNLIGNYSRRISISDWEHFYNNKDWYAVEDQKAKVDRSSIIYDPDSALGLKGFRAARQGQIATKDNDNGLVWTDPLNQQALDEAVENARTNANLAGNYAVTAGNKAIEANGYAKDAAESVDEIKGLFWRGTLEEYNALTEIDPEVIYLIIT